VSDLVTWLREQLDDDAQVANSATSGPWDNDDRLMRDAVCAPAVDEWVADCRYEQMGPFAVHNATHIARHDPARVLAEVEAKRAILDEHNLSYEGSRECYSCSDKRGDDIEPYPCPTVRLLALPYADRPGYRDEWRPRP
jgi:Family of unknown function (DUF6221)